MWILIIILSFFFCFVTIEIPLLHRASMPLNQKVNLAAWEITEDLLTPTQLLVASLVSE